MKTCADLTFGGTVNANLPYKLRSFSLTKHCPVCEIKSELYVKSKEKGEIISSLQNMSNVFQNKEKQQKTRTSS